MIAEIQAARDRAESATDVHEIWKATLHEVTLRWKRAGQPSNSPDNEVGLMMSLCLAMRDKDRVATINRIEEWRTAWLNLLHQRDMTSSAKLNVIDSFRRAKGEVE